MIQKNTVLVHKTRSWSVLFRTLFNKAVNHYNHIKLVTYEWTGVEHRCNDNDRENPKYMDRTILQWHSHGMARAWNWVCAVRGQQLTVSDMTLPTWCICDAWYQGTQYQNPTWYLRINGTISRHMEPVTKRGHWHIIGTWYTRPTWDLCMLWEHDPEPCCTFYVHDWTVPASGKCYPYSLSACLHC
jgi:hypothetical protein